MKYANILIVLASLLVTACSGLSTGRLAESSSHRSPAKLLSYSIDERFVHIDVISNGCTLISSFELLLVDKNTNSIQVIRRKPDTCIVKPIRISLDYSYRHLGIDPSHPVSIVNPILMSEVASFD